MRRSFRTDLFAAYGKETRISDGAFGRVVGRLPADIGGIPEGLHPGGNRHLGRTAGDKAAGGTVGPNDMVLLDWKSGRGLAALGGLSPEPPDEFRSTDARPQAGVSADGKTAVVASELGEVLVFDLSAVP